MRILRSIVAVVAAPTLAVAPALAQGSEGPLGEWPDFTPIGFITAPHPDYPEVQTHLYGDWARKVPKRLDVIFLLQPVVTPDRCGEISVVPALYVAHPSAQSVAQPFGLRNS